MKEQARICFSDIDGPIMHDPAESGREAELLVTPPSASGRRGAISALTLTKVASLRSKGVKFVVITGARLSTLLMRLPFLPAADAFVCENGECPLPSSTIWAVQVQPKHPVFNCPSPGPAPDDHS